MWLVFTKEEVVGSGRATALSGGFEASLLGLYFVGVFSAKSFGSLMYFAFGADFTARRISRYLERSVRSAASNLETEESARLGERP
jgi:hypothetical protein